MINELIYLILLIFSCSMVYLLAKAGDEKRARTLAQKFYEDKEEALRQEFREENDREMGFYREKVNIDFKRWQQESENKIREDSLNRSRASLKGKITEQIAPMLNEFPYVLSDARFIGSPLDYVIFSGYSDGREDIEVVFVDIKTGNAELTLTQRRIKDAVESGKVKWNTIRIE